jgi:hypothetical protein
MSSDLEIEDWYSYKQLLHIYHKFFSLGFLDTDFKTKMALISLICYTTHKLKSKKPDITHYQIIQKLAVGKGIPDRYLKALAVVCDEFGYGCTEFPTFDLNEKEILNTIKDIFDKFVPF